MNKKIFGIVIVSVLVVLLIVICFINPNSTRYSDEPDDIIANAKEEVSRIKSNQRKKLVEINVDKYIELYKGEEKSVVYIGRPTCQYCQIAKPIIENIAYKYKLKIYYLNVDNFKEGDAQKFMDSDPTLSDSFGTPTLLVVNKGGIHDAVDTLKDTRHYISFFKDNGYIK